MFPRWKAAVAAVLAAVLAWCGALALVGWYQPAQQADLPMSGQKRLHSVELPILMYHHIHKSASQWGDHVVSPQTLEGDFQYLTAQGYTAVTVADLTAYTQNGTPLPEKPIMITFDDGQLSVLEYALPLLEQYDLKAVVAVVGSFADAYTQSGDRNINYACMNWKDIRKLTESGRVEIANHTYDMHNLKKRRGCQKMDGESLSQYRSALAADFEKNRAKIQAATGVKPTAFAFPFGALSKEARKVLKAEGYQVMLTCTEQVNHLTGDPNELCDLGRFNRANSLDRETLFQKLEN